MSTKSININQCWYRHVCTNGECNEDCIRFLEMRALIEQSGLTYKQSNPPILEAGIDYEQFVYLDEYKTDIVYNVESGSSLYICSQHTGNGKTTWAIKILMRYFNDVWPGNAFRRRGMFIHVPDLMFGLKDFHNRNVEDLRRRVINTDLVVLDDIASTRFTDYDEMLLLSIIEGRLARGYSTIYTSNIVGSEGLSRVIGPRLSSRIYDSSVIVQLRGKDRRHDTATANQQDIDYAGYVRAR